MLEAHYTPRAPRVRTADGAVRRRLALQEGGDGDLLLDLSGGGMKVLSARALEAGDLLDVELQHPRLRGAISLEARVQWARPSAARAGQVELGLRFEGLRDTTRVALEQVMAAELGAPILCRGRGAVGWLSAPREGLRPPGPPSHFVYDLDRREVAVLRPLDGRFRVERRGVEREFDGLVPAVAWALDQPVTHVELPLAVE